MKKLFVNEFRRIKISQYLLTLIVSNIIVIFLASTSYMLLSNPSSGPTSVAPTLPSFALSTIDLAMMLLRAVIIVWQAVLITQIIVSEYESRTITLLYSFPYKRIQLVLSKIILVSMLILSAYFISILFQNVVIYIISIYSSSISFTLNIKLIDIISIFTTIVVGFIPLAVGIKLKSSVSVIVSSLVIVMAISNSQGNNQGLLTIPIISIILAIISIVILVFTIIKMDKEDL
ncbi:hypothetical protein [Clostridium rectalis]|uniref:hypothetical protein n=1 Tax=Clostridium rectalis TaxID=2040295 RepID=UPI000F63C2B5|nr:hypothetical protein [Clostridium rectalis]